MCAEIIDITKRFKGARKPEKGPGITGPSAKPFFVRKAHAMSREDLAGSISSVIARLEYDLKDGAAHMRTHIESHVRSMGSGKQDELAGMGMAFEVPGSVRRIEIADGEARKPGVEKKISSIIAACVRVAESDLDALKAAQSAMASGGTLSEEQIASISPIIDQGTYWRYFTTT